MQTSCFFLIFFGFVRSEWLRRPFFGEFYETRRLIFFWFSSVIRCLEQLWLDAPGGLPRLKDNENRAETYVFFIVFL